METYATKNITKIKKYKKKQNKNKKTEQHFFDGTQLHTSKPPTKMINKNIQSTTDKYTLFITVTKNSEERKAI